MINWIAVGLIRIARFISQDVFKKEFGDMVNDLSIRVMMTHLDKLGVDHCLECAQTHGLFYKDGAPYCQKHKQTRKNVKGR